MSIVFYFLCQVTEEELCTMRVCYILMANFWVLTCYCHWKYRVRFQIGNT